MLNVGEKVPDFTLPLVHADGRRDPVGFHQLLQETNGPIVLGFFPAAFTPGCTREMCEFRDRQAVFDQVGAKAVGFSVDTPASVVEFARQNRLEHPIYADPNHKVVDALWATMTVGGIERRAKRGWMVVTRDAVVAAAWVTDTPSEWSGIGPIEAALQKAAARPA